MFPLANVVHFFPDKFAGLSRCGLALSPVSTGPFESSFFWHKIFLFADCSRWHYQRTVNPASIGLNPLVANASGGFGNDVPFSDLREYSPRCSGLIA